MFRRCHESRLHRVEVNIPAQVDQVLFAIDPYVAKTPLKKGPFPSLLAIHGLHVCVEEHPDELG